MKWWLPYGGVTRRPLPLTVKTQGYVAADLYKTRSGAIVLHLVNYEKRRAAEDGGSDIPPAAERQRAGRAIHSG